MSQTLKDLLNENFEKYADRAAVRVLRQAEQTGEKGLRYVPITYKQLRDQRNRLASGFALSGLQKGQRIGLLTDGGLESVLVFLACDMLGLSTVPLCNKLPDDLLIHNINHSGIVWLISDAKSLDQVDRIRPQLDNPPEVVLTEGHPENAKSFFELVQKGAQAPPPEVDIDPDDESKVLFTSGSSGLPKGVMQTHRNLVGNVMSVMDVISTRDELVFFKSAPDYHTMGILNIYYVLAKGWTLDLARSPDRVLADIRHSEPHGFLTVPLILDKVYGNVRKEIEAGGTRGKLIARSVRAKQRIARKKGSLLDKLVYAAIGRKVVAQIKAKLSQRVGSRLEVLIVGSAKADAEALDFFQDVLDIRAFEGYGVTECSPLIAANTLHGQRNGTVGQPFQEVKLMTETGVEIAHGDPSTHQFKGSGAGIGELWVHGNHVMTGYLDEPEKTAEVLVTDDEDKVWYRTGDLFSMDDEGFLTFQGRVGRQFKLKNGEFVNPERLERIFSRVTLIEHVLVCGDQSRTFPLPVATVNVEEARLQTDIPDLPKDDDALRRHPAIAERIRERLLKEATDAGLPGHERPQKVLVLPLPLTEESGTLTRGLKKVVPKQIVSQYEADIHAAYE
ncbi:MAG: AMP-binding protein [Candidatus Latescibacteria bacterium]|jgi:long-chain acyl-CoA synthetase|nr:AMP-binding protein [Candidatus Latescibacterota bacterium]MBT4137235.1 AMP-binding protein [Candidatus Latescibacterota bacterium]